MCVFRNFFAFTEVGLGPGIHEYSWAAFQLLQKLCTPWSTAGAYSDGQRQGCFLKAFYGPFHSKGQDELASTPKAGEAGQVGYPGPFSAVGLACRGALILGGRGGGH